MKKSKDKTMPPRELTVGEVAVQTGVAISTIHFYEDKGLIVGTHSRRHRRFPHEVLKRVSLIKAAKNAGTPLSVVAELLMALPKDRAATPKDWRLLLACWRADLDMRLEQLTEQRSELAHCAACGCLSVETCPLVIPPTSHR